MNVKNRNDKNRSKVNLVNNWKSMKSICKTMREGMRKASFNLPVNSFFLSNLDFR